MLIFNNVTVINWILQNIFIKHNLYKWVLWVLKEVFRNITASSDIIAEVYLKFIFCDFLLVFIREQYDFKIIFFLNYDSFFVYVFQLNYFTGIYVIWTLHKTKNTSTTIIQWKWELRRSSQQKGKGWIVNLSSPYTPLQFTVTNIPQMIHFGRFKLYAQSWEILDRR